MRRDREIHAVTDRETTRWIASDRQRGDRKYRNRDGNVETNREKERETDRQRERH